MAVDVDDVFGWRGMGDGSDDGDGEQVGMKRVGASPGKRRPWPGC